MPEQKETKLLMPAQEKWLLDRSGEAWGWYMAFKHSPDQRRDACRAAMPEDIKPILRDAYKQFK